MIFETQERVNSYLSAGHSAEILNIDGVMALGLSNTIDHDFETPAVKKERLFYLGRNLLIDEFGGIYDLDNEVRLSPSMVRVNNSPALAVPFKNTKGQTVYKRVIQLVAMAILKDAAPKKVHTKVNDYRLVMLDNLNVVKHKSPQGEFIHDIDTMPIRSQREMDLFCYRFGIRSSQDAKSIFNLDDNRYNQFNPNRLEIKSSPSYGEFTTRKSEVKLAHNIGGTRIYASAIGAIFRLKGDNLVPAGSYFMDRGALRVKIYCEDGKTRQFYVRTLVAKAFGGYSEQRKIKHIDENPLNCHINNLWWHDCGREYGFGVHSFDTSAR